MGYRRWLIICGAAVVLAGIVAVGWHFLHQPPSASYTEARIVVDDRHVFRVRVADTPEKQVKGLSGTASLADDEGMYFPLDSTTSHSFWMKDMIMPIDIIWIKQGAVVGIEHEAPVPPANASDNDIAIYPQPVEAIDGVLEIQSGRSKELGIEVGSRVDPLVVVELD